MQQTCIYPETLRLKCNHITASGTCHRHGTVVRVTTNSRVCPLLHSNVCQLHAHGSHDLRRRLQTCAASVAITASETAGAAVPDDGNVLAYQKQMLSRMMSFLGPATLIPLGEPLMSLVDTICIGQFAGTSQLAALGPANLVFSFAQYMFQSLQVATLSLLAGFMRDGRLRRSEETLSTAVVMAAVLGVVTTVILEAFPEAIILATGLRDPSLLPLSAEYVRLRGLAQPAVLVTMVAQSGLMAQQDSLTPALTVALSVAVSLIGSIVFVAGLGCGLAGAAGTTVACQYVGAAALLYALSVRGKLRISLSPPRRDTVWQLLRTMAPLSITYLCKNVSYLFIQTTAATLETTKLAAHQALFSVWNLLAWTVSPFEQAALTYLPGIRGWRKSAGISLLVGLGAAGGVLCGAVLAALVSVAPQLMTRDAAVWPHMQSVAHLASMSMLALGADVVSSGVNIGMGDARYVAQSYIITLVALGGFMAASRALGWELPGVWSGVVVFFGVRALQSTGRVFWQHLRPGAAAAAEAADAAADAAARVRDPSLATSDEESARAGFLSVQSVETAGSMDAMESVEEAGVGLAAAAVDKPSHLHSQQLAHQQQLRLQQQQQQHQQQQDGELRHVLENGHVIGGARAGVEAAAAAVQAAAGGFEAEAAADGSRAIPRAVAVRAMGGTQE